MDCYADAVFSLQVREIPPFVRQNLGIESKIEKGVLLEVEILGRDVQHDGRILAARQGKRNLPRIVAEGLETPEKNIAHILHPLAAGRGLCTGREPGDITGGTGDEAARTGRRGRGRTETAFGAASVSGGCRHSLPRCKKFVGL